MAQWSASETPVRVTAPAASAPRGPTRVDPLRQLQYLATDALGMWVIVVVVGTFALPHVTDITTLRTWIRPVLYFTGSAVFLLYGATTFRRWRDPAVRVAMSALLAAITVGSFALGVTALP